ncbi:MBL fold metallo-hydrolase [Thermus sp.]
MEVVVLGRLHFDRAANTDLFSWGEVWVHEAELDHALWVYRDPRVDPACLAHLPGVLRRLQPVGEGRVASGLALFHLPGHTPGLLGLEVEGVGVLVSDAVKSRYDLEGSPAPPCWSPDLAQGSCRRLLAYPRLFPGHDVPLRKEGEAFLPEGEAELLLWLGDGQEVVLRL